MNARIVRCWVAILAAVLAVGLASGATELNHRVAMADGADAEISLQTPYRVAPVRGFLPLRVRIVNRAARERTWKLEVEMSESWGMAASDMTITAFEFRVAAGVTREFVVYAAVVGRNSGLGGRNVTCRVVGPGVAGDRFGLGLSQNYNRSYQLLSEAALEAFFNHEVAEAEKAARASGRYRPWMASIQPTPIIDPAAWPADWRVWSGFPVVVLTQATWTALDEARRLALQDWVAMGGRLLLVPEAYGPGTRVLVGAGVIETMTSPVKQWQREKVGENNFQPSHGGRAEWMAAGEHWSWDIRRWSTPTAGGWLSGFVIVFAVLIGPVNLFYFARAGRRHRLFFTVPAISLGASAVLGAAILIGDGWGGKGTRRSLVVLIPERNQAVVVQSQLSRTGMLGRREFALADDAEFETSRELATNEFSLRRWRENGQASGDWFVNRDLQRQWYRRLVPTRERVELVRERDGSLVAQSTVGATLRDFAFRDANWRYWIADSLAPGQRVKLRDAGTETPPALKIRASREWRVNYFYARAEGGTLGLVETLPTIRWQDDVVLYTGELQIKEAKP